MFLVLVLLLLAGPAWAQQPAENTAMRGLALAIQQASVAAEQYVTDVDRRMAAKDARIAELEKLCGELCKKESK